MLIASQGAGRSARVQDDAALRLSIGAGSRITVERALFTFDSVAGKRGCEGLHSELFMFKRSAIGLMTLAVSFTPVLAYDAARVRDILAGATGGTVCKGRLSGWCAALGMEAAYWVDKNVALAIDRHFQAKDQEFANKTRITVCYHDGNCIKPK